MVSNILLFQVYVHLLFDMLDLKWIIADEMTEGDRKSDRSASCQTCSSIIVYA